MSGIDPSATVHPMAVVEDGAQIGAGCTIGPFAIIGPEVTLAENVTVKTPRAGHRLDRDWRGLHHIFLRIGGGNPARPEICR